MLRLASVTLLLALLASSTGCRMCAHPYDYCGPLFGSDGCTDCYSDNPRRGSVLSGQGCDSCGSGGEGYADGEMVDGPYEGDPSVTGEGYAEGDVIEGDVTEGDVTATVDPSGEAEYSDAGYSDGTVVEEGRGAWDTAEEISPPSPPPVDRRRIEESFESSDDSAAMPRPIPDPRTGWHRARSLRR